MFSLEEKADWVEKRPLSTWWMRERSKLNQIQKLAGCFLLFWTSQWNIKRGIICAAGKKFTCTSVTLMSESNMSCCHGECILQTNKSRKRPEEDIWAQLKAEAWGLWSLVRHLDIKDTKWNDLPICAAFLLNSTLNHSDTFQIEKWEILCSLFGETRSLLYQRWAFSWWSWRGALNSPKNFEK